MLQAILTTIEEDGTPNEVVLDVQSKGTILRYVKQAIVNPNKYRLSVRDDYSELEDKTEAKDLVTLAEWLLEKNINLDKSTMHTLASLVAKKYKEHYQKAPRVVARPNKKGTYNKKAYGFDEDELWVLIEALAEVKRKAVTETRPATSPK